MLFSQIFLELLFPVEGDSNIFHRIILCLFLYYQGFRKLIQNEL